MEQLRQTPRPAAHTRALMPAAEAATLRSPHALGSSADVSPAPIGGPSTGVVTPARALATTGAPRPATQQPQPQQQNPLAAVRVEIAALAASVNAAIVGMQASIDHLTARCARIERRLGEESRRAAEGQRVVAGHVESLWRAIDGSREATNWCWARATPATEGRAWLRTRLVGHHQHHQQHQQHGSRAHDVGDAAATVGPRGHDQEHVDHKSVDVHANNSGGGRNDRGDGNAALVMDVGEGGWLCVRYPMVHALDDAGAKCVWMRTTLVDDVNGDMCHYWIKAYDLDAQVAFLCEYTNVPPCFDTEPIDEEDEEDDEDGDNEDDVENGSVSSERPDQAGADRDKDKRRGGSAHHQRYRDARDESATSAPVILREGPHPNAIGGGQHIRSGGDGREDDDYGSEDNDDDFSSDGGPL